MISASTKAIIGQNQHLDDEKVVFKIAAKAIQNIRINVTNTKMTNENGTAYKAVSISFKINIPDLRERFVKYESNNKKLTLQRTKGKLRGKKYTNHWDGKIEYYVWHNRNKYTIMTNAMIKTNVKKHPNCNQQ